MAKLKNEMVIKIENLETIDRISNAIELQREMETLLKRMRYDLDECMHLVSPYKRRYGIELPSLLGAVLETYHQLRLKDD